MTHMHSLLLKNRHKWRLRCSFEKEEKRKFFPFSNPLCGSFLCFDWKELPVKVQKNRTEVGSSLSKNDKKQQKWCDTGLLKCKIYVEKIIEKNNNNI